MDLDLKGADSRMGHVLRGDVFMMHG